MTMGYCTRCGAPFGGAAASCAACGQTVIGFAQTGSVGTPAAPQGASAQGWAAAPPLPPTTAQGIGPTVMMSPQPTETWNGAPVSHPSGHGYAAAPTPARSNAVLLLVVAVAVVAAGAGAGAALYFRGGSRSDVRALEPSSSLPPPAPLAPSLPPVPPVPPAPRPSPQEIAAPQASAPNVGLAFVHYRVGVDAPGNALGQPDQRVAVIRAGVLTLQMADGHQLVSDGTPDADVRIECDTATPGPYRVEIGVGHNVFVPVADDVRGSAAIDLDHAGVRVGRFVRVSTRASGSSLALDAVLVRTPVAAPAAPPIGL
jgi:hypothetical protein